jgi:hypothetical protein
LENTFEGESGLRARSGGTQVRVLVEFFSKKKKKNGAAQRRAGCTSWRGQVRVMRVRILPHGWTGISYGTDTQQS